MSCSRYPARAPRSSSSLQPFFNGRNRLVWNRAADDVVDEREVIVRIVMGGAHLLEAGLVGKFFEQSLPGRVNVARQRKNAEMHFAKLARGLPIAFLCLYDRVAV